VKNTYQIAEAQAQLSALTKRKEILTLCRHNEPVSYLVPRERMEAIVETLEILANPQAMKVLRAARRGRLKYRPVSALDAD
jgi:PHD/YefM family antitoxin component YafN of YafNO toxin-antitoxin module